MPDSQQVEPESKTKKIYTEEVEANGWGKVYYEEVNVECLPFGCYWLSKLPAAE